MRQRGFSLLEVTVVVVLMGLATVLLARGLGIGFGGQQLRQTTAELAAGLRATRTVAMISGREQVFLLDVPGRRWQSPGPGGRGQRIGSWPVEVEVAATVAREEQPASNVAAIRFFPDGGSSGGRVIVRRGEAELHVDVHWLTGRVRQRRAGAG